MFGVSKESKAYRLYNPETCKIMISRDVHFDESIGWEWEDKMLEKELDWGESTDTKSVGERGHQINHNEQQVPEENLEEPNEDIVEEEIQQNLKFLFLFLDSEFMSCHVR